MRGVESALGREVVNPPVNNPLSDETLRGTARSLLSSVNDASIAARNGWLFFLALLAYLFIAAASVSHKDLLLNTPVVLPFLGIALRLDSFFLFGPMVLLFVHFGLLVQHVLLSRKIIELDTILTEDEHWRGRRMHPLRLELHSYFYTQALAGANRSAVFATFLHGMVWLSLVLLPVFLILYFQITFLPYHAEGITWAHRVYLMVELIILIGVGIFLRKPNANFWQALWRTGRQHSTNFFVTLSLVVVALFFSICVVTFPGEWIDRQLSKISPLAIADQRGDVKQGQAMKAQVFAPTAYFFADTGHTVKEFQGLFHRNLSVVDEDVVTNEQITSEDVSVSLRGRNLRYANLSRSDLSKADFTDAKLENAVLEGTILTKAKFGCRDLQEETITDAQLEDYQARGCAMLERADFSSADLSNADFRSTYSHGARFNNATLNGARFDWAILSKATFESAKGARTSFVNSFITEGNFFGAQMQGADFSGVVALASNFSNANLQGTIFSLAHLQAVSFETAQLNVADLTLADLWGTNFTDAEIGGADFSSAEIWGPIPPPIDDATRVYFANVEIDAPSESQRGEIEKALGWKLTPETVARLQTLLAPESVADWPETNDYKSWMSIKAGFDNADIGSLRQSYTDYVVKIACQNARVNKETTAGVITRVAKPNFSGDIEAFLVEMRKPECGVMKLISAELREQLLAEVHRRRRDGF